MRVRFPAVVVMAAAVASSVPAAAHHSNPLYFDMSNPITLEGTVMRVEWIHPHLSRVKEREGRAGDLGSPGLFAEQRGPAAWPEGTRAAGCQDCGARVPSPQPVVCERRADGAADKA